MGFRAQVVHFPFVGSYEARAYRPAVRPVSGIAGGLTMG